MTMLEERVSSMEGAYEHLATRADLERVRGDMITELERVRGDTSAAIEKVRADLISEIRSSETRMVKWVAGMMVGTALGIVTATAALLRLFL